MDRVPEPELMEDPAQALAYARADFCEVNQGFVDRFCAAFPDVRGGTLIDLGCGPADIPIRLARALPGLEITAMDGSDPMLCLARAAVADAGLAARIRLLHARLPGLPLEPRSFDAVISNSLLHHLPEPQVFWKEVIRLGRPGAAVFVMDLFRPDSLERAREIVRTAAADEDPILKRDFLSSLLAAWTADEVRSELASLLPHIDCRIISDRHWLVSGRLP